MPQTLIRKRDEAAKKLHEKLNVVQEEDEAASACETEAAACEAASNEAAACETAACEAAASKAEE